MLSQQAVSLARKSDRAANVCERAARGNHLSGTYRFCHYACTSGAPQASNLRPRRFRGMFLADPKRSVWSDECCCIACEISVMKQPDAGSIILRIKSTPVPATSAIQSQRSPQAYRAAMQPPGLDCVSHWTLGGVVMDNCHDAYSLASCPRTCKSAHD